MPLRLEDIINYRGDLQPDRWSLHPEDFRIRMDWEYDRQRILNAQAHSIEKKLPYPTEKIPPIPRLLHPEYAARRVVTEVVTQTVTEGETVTKKPQLAVTPVTETPEERKKRKNREKQARFKAKKKEV